MSYFDEKMPRGPVRPVDQYQPLCHWSSLIGTHYLEAQQIIQREAPWAHIFLMPTSMPVVRSNHRSQNPETRGQCCKTSPLSTPNCFGSELRIPLGTPKFGRVTIFYDPDTGLVTRVPVRG